MKKNIIKTKLNRLKNNLKDSHILNPMSNSKGMELIQKIGLMVVALTLVGVLFVTVNSESGTQLGKIQDTFISMYNNFTDVETDGSVDVNVDQKKVYAIDSKTFNGKSPDYYAKASNTVLRSTSSSNS